MQRRHLLGALSSATIALACWPRLALGRLESRPAPSLAYRLVGALRQQASATRVGRAFLRAHPAEADVGRLTASLADDLCGQACDPASAGSSPAGLRAAFARQVRADFTTGRVTRVDGWVLSVTEARLCGLAALVAAV